MTTEIPKDILDKVDPKNLQVDATFKADLKKQLLAMEDTTMARASKQSKTPRLLDFFKYNFASIVAILAVVLVVGGASAIVSSSNAKNQLLRETSIPETLDGLVPIDQIRQTAQNDVPEGTILGIELEQEDEGLLYKVKFSDGTVRFYDARTGLVISKSDEKDENEDVPADFNANLTLQEARDIAQNQRPGKIISKIELESENGIIVFSVRFTDGGRVDVNAENGSVVRVRNGDTSSSNRSSGDDNDDDRSGSNSGSSHDDDNDDDRSGSGGGDDDNSGSGSSGSGSSHDD